MSVLKLIPACKEYLWGGEKLRQNFGVQSEATPLAEAWVFSTHPSGMSVIEQTGETLADYVERNPGCLGTNCPKGGDNPVLIKLIDAKETLSVQVHPDEEYAMKHEGQHGKTEMWYVLEAEPNAQLYYGFSRPVSREEFVRRAQDETLLDVLHAVPVKKNDLFFIPAGTLHAIGKGMVVAEVQQNSNMTYRIYDYGRRDRDGNLRPLHLEQAADVLTMYPTPVPTFQKHLAQCDYFTVDILQGDASGDCDCTSFLSLLVLEGEGVLQCGEGCTPIKKGDSLFLPAGSGRYALKGTCKILQTSMSPMKDTERGAQVS